MAPGGKQQAMCVHMRANMSTQQDTNVQIVISMAEVFVCVCVCFCMLALLILFGTLAPGFCV